MKTLFSIFFLLFTTTLALAQDSFEQAVYHSEGDSLQYRIQYPLNYDQTKKYPLVFLLT